MPTHHLLPATRRRAVAAAGAVALVAGAALAAFDAAPAEATPTDGGRVSWSIEPATAEGPDDRVSLRHEVEPGARVDDHVAVTNQGDVPVTFAVYAADGVTSSSGAFDVLPPGAESTAAGTWIDVPDEVALEPGETRVLPVTVQVPEDARPGDHPAGVVAVLRASGDGGAVTSENRVGVRLHLRVAGDLAAGLAIDDVTMTHEPGWNPFAPGTTTLDYTLRNTGDVRLGATPIIAVTGPFGIPLAEATGEERRELLPGESAPASVVLDGLWPLFHHAGLVTVEPAVVGDDVIDAALVSATAEASAAAIPVPQLALLALVALLVVLVVVQRRRAARRVAALVEAARAEGAAQGIREPADA